MNSRAPPEERHLCTARRTNPREDQVIMPQIQYSEKYYDDVYEYR